jgi:hypothetical protein
MKKTILTILLSAASAVAIDYFPIQAGNTWTYRDANTGHEFTIRLGAPVVRNDQTYHPLTGYATEPLLVRRGDSTDLVYLDETFGREVMLTQFNVSGAPWPAPRRGCYHEGVLGGTATDHDGPAGPFRDVFPITYRVFGCADTGVQEEQFAPGIGLVRRVVGSIAGARKYDLVYARVGNQVIDAAMNGRFTAAVREIAGSDELEVTMRVHTGPGPAIRLQYSSSQEFDIAVRDEYGHRVWVWSADKLFTPAFRERTVSGEWSTSVRIPRPRLNGGYIVEAWLTTTDTSVKYATAASLPAAKQ